MMSLTVLHKLGQSAYYIMHFPLQCTWRKIKGVSGTQQLPLNRNDELITFFINCLVFPKAQTPKTFGYYCINEDFWKIGRHIFTFEEANGLHFESKLLNCLNFQSFYWMVWTLTRGVKTMSIGASQKVGSLWDERLITGSHVWNTFHSFYFNDRNMFRLKSVPQVKTCQRSSEPSFCE